MESSSDTILISWLSDMIRLDLGRDPLGFRQVDNSCDVCDVCDGTNYKAFYKEATSGK